MLSWAGKMTGDPGWKLRCVDPPIAWLRLSRASRTEIGIRIQLSCYLSSRRAQPVKIRETRLLLEVNGREVAVPSTGVTDIGGGRFPEPPGHSITGYETEHALAYFATDDPEVVSLLGDVGPPVPLIVEAMVNTSEIYRRIATFELVGRQKLATDAGWSQVGTGR